MIKEFETITADLNTYQIETIVPIVVDELTFRCGSKMAITSNKVIQLLNRDHDIRIDPAQFRKIISHIRVHGLLDNLVATSKGYFIATTKEEMETYLEGLGQRIRQITLVYDSLQYQMERSISGRLNI